MSKETKISKALSDHELISYICKEYERLMYYTVRKYISDTHQCEDIVQASLEKLIEKVQTLRGLSEPALANYIAVTVKNMSINYLKRQDTEKSKREDLRLKFSESLLEIESLDEILITKEDLDRLKKIWPMLNEETRVLLEGKYFLGYDNKKLAAVFGCTPNSVRMKLTRARRVVLKLLKEGELVE